MTSTHCDKISKSQCVDVEWTEFSNVGPILTNQTKKTAPRIDKNKTSNKQNKKRSKIDHPGPEIARPRGFVRTIKRQTTRTAKSTRTHLYEPLGPSQTLCDNQPIEQKAEKQRIKQNKGVSYGQTSDTDNRRPNQLTD